MALPKAKRDYYKSFSQHGAGDNLVVLNPEEVVLLLNICNLDINGKPLPNIPEDINKISLKGYYKIIESDLDSLKPLSDEIAYKYIEDTGCDVVSEFTMYLRKLCDLHRKRFKYRNILKNQPFPTVEQIGPRSLLEFGNCESELLFNWMCWRKWAYDIDNRSAQETGYLFEPILVSCIDGETLSHTKSPVKRLDESGNPTNEGRQVDCLVCVEDVKYAYELKMRVTIAASGQGRFNEEMTFPIEAKNAGIVPVLVVFDPTDSTLLAKLKKAYLENDGKVYIGDKAWSHLKDRAGELMGQFIDKYIEPPIKNMELSYPDVPYPIRLEATKSSITISDCKSVKYEIKKGT